MKNEMLLILSVLFNFGMVLLWYKFFGSKGLMCFSVLATVAANIEVLILIEAFGMEQTLGNVLFASTFLVTDILSENEGKKSAQTAVNLGIMASVSFVLISQYWLLYSPSEADTVFPAIRTVFTGTPRIVLASLLVYAISQRFDVWAYHKWWAFTTKKFGDSHKYLWLRNNGSTLISQLINAILFNIGAFLGVYDTKTLLFIIGSTYVIYIITSLLDTPFVYLARKMHDKKVKLKPEV